MSTFDAFFVFVGIGIAFAIGFRIFEVLANFVQCFFEWLFSHHKKDR